MNWIQGLGSVEACSMLCPDETLSKDSHEWIVTDADLDCGGSPQPDLILWPQGPSAGFKTIVAIPFVPNGTGNVAVA